MKTTLLHVRRLAVAAALLGVVFSPRVVSAQSDLDASEAEAFLGDWIVSVESDFGAFDVNLKIEDQGGKVAASVALPEQGVVEVTDITRSGDDLVLSYELDTQGQLISVSVTLEPDGEDLIVEFDFGGDFVVDGTNIFEHSIIAEANPDTLVKWTKSEIDAAEFGMELSI